MRCLFGFFTGLCLSFAIAIAAAPSAAASTVTWEINFKGEGFTGILGAPGLIDPVEGTVFLTFDPNQDYHDETHGIWMNGSNAPLGSTLAFSWLFFSHDLTIGGLNHTTNGIDGGTDDFILAVFNPPNWGGLLIYTTAGTNDSFFASHTSVSVSEAPLPPSAPLLVAALACLAVVAWRGHNRRAVDAIR